MSPRQGCVYLNEQKVESVSKAAVFADEFVLTHRGVPRTEARPIPAPHGSGGRECFYCHETGHMIAGCPTLQGKEQHQNLKKP